MADRYRIGTNVSWNDTSNWTGASVPADAEAIYIDRGSADLTSDLDQTGGDIDPASLYCGGTFTGSIGDESTNSLKFDDISGYIEIDCSGNPDQILNLWADTVPLAMVHNTGSHTYACYFRAGTITTLKIDGGQNIRLGGSLTVTNLTVTHSPGKPVPQIHIVQGCTLSGVMDVRAGVVKCYGAVAASTFRLSGTARWYHLGEGVGNITNTLAVHGNAAAYLLGGGWTIGALETADNGIIDATPRDGYRSGPYTYTNATAKGGFIINKRNDVFSNTPVEEGTGSIPFAATKTVHKAGHAGGGGV